MFEEAFSDETDCVLSLLTNRFFWGSVVDRTVRKRFLAQWVIPLWGGQGKPEHRKLFLQERAVLLRSDGCIVMEDNSVVTHALAQALSLYVYGRASSPCVPASCASLQTAFPRYQDCSRRAHSSQAKNHVFGGNRRCNEGKAAVQSFLYPPLVCFQAISQHLLAGCQCQQCLL